MRLTKFVKLYGLVIVFALLSVLVLSTRPSRVDALAFPKEAPQTYTGDKHTNKVLIQGDVLVDQFDVYTKPSIISNGDLRESRCLYKQSALVAQFCNKTAYYRIE